MSTSAKSVRFDENSMWVDLSDGRIIAVPLAWFPRLLKILTVNRAHMLPLYAVAMGQTKQVNSKPPSPFTLG
ncbi:MAG: DUF2442 domain-containing protein [Hydrogenophilales bacterium]|nr:DUF2442 domain-containing protein [Hydrogenophilales bacterium]